MAITASYQAWLAQIAACSSKNGAYQFSRKAPAPPPPPPPPTVEQQLAALATEVYRAPATRVAALQATDPPHDRLSADAIYAYRRQQLQKREFAVDTPAQAGGGVLGNLAESVYRERARACGTR